MWPRWLVRGVNWMTYQLGLGLSLEQASERFEETFGALSPEQMAEMIDLAEEAEENQEELANLPIDSPISDVLGGAEPPAALVTVTATVTFEKPDKSLDWRQFQIDVPWTTDVLDIYFQLEVAAEDRYEWKIVGIQITGPLLF